MARLSGAAAALRAAIGAPRSATDRAGHERIIAEARAALSPTAFTAAWAEGEAAPLERVMAEALAVRPV